MPPAFEATLPVPVPPVATVSWYVLIANTAAVVVAAAGIVKLQVAVVDVSHGPPLQ